MTPEEFDKKVTTEFEKYKTDFLNKLNKQTNGENDETLEHD